MSAAGAGKFRLCALLLVITKEILGNRYRFMPRRRALYREAGHDAKNTPSHWSLFIQSYFNFFLIR